MRCGLCPHNCLIHSGRVGICYVRKNHNGKLLALAYGRSSAAHLDPIEKKPLFRFKPGANIYSVSGLGCNLGCPYCQNWEIAHPKDLFEREEPATVVERMTKPLSPREAVAEAVRLRERGNIGIAYTYNEPLIGWEYIRDTAQLAHKEGLVNVLVTNGYINEEPLKAIIPLIDAANIDIKGFSDEFYRRLGGRLQPVLKAASMLAKGCHIEVTNLLIPTWNSEEQQVRQLVDWVADNLGPQTPLHFSRYFPSRRLALPPTPLDVLRRAKQIGEERLEHVYLGNA